MRCTLPMDRPIPEVCLLQLDAIIGHRTPRTDLLTPDIVPCPFGKNCDRYIPV